MFSSSWSYPFLRYWGMIKNILRFSGTFNCWPVYFAKDSLSIASIVCTYPTPKDGK
jgi:hypothetical protein